MKIATHNRRFHNRTPPLHPDPALSPPGVPLCLTMKINELAAALGCSVCSPAENLADLEITGVRGLEQAGPGHLTFLSNPKYAPKLKLTQASAVLASKPVEVVTTLTSANPYHDYARALELFYQPPKRAPGIHPSAAISATAKIGEGAS